MQLPIKLYLTRQEAAGYLTARGSSTAFGTLQKLASIGGGPQYRIAGRNALYRAEDLDAWIDSKPAKLSATSKAGAK